jgi:hypothetical protein
VENPDGYDRLLPKLVTHYFGGIVVMTVHYAKVANYFTELLELKSPHGYGWKVQMT